MHRSVLQNKKYMKFADGNTVEVISVSSVPKPNSGDKRVATYKGKDGNDYMVEWPGLTHKQLSNSNGGFNKSGKIPYVAIVNPHTGEEFVGFNGGSAGKIMDIVSELQKEMEKEHGKGVKRSTLRKLDKDKAKIAALLAKNKVRDALSKYSAMAKKAAKSEALQNYIKDSLDGILKVAARNLSKAEGLIEQGDPKSAGKILRPLVRALKDTPLAERAADLDAKTKAKAE